MVWQQRLSNGKKAHSHLPFTPHACGCVVCAPIRSRLCTGRHAGEANTLGCVVRAQHTLRTCALTIPLIGATTGLRARARA